MSSIDLQLFKSIVDLTENAVLILGVSNPSEPVIEYLNAAFLRRLHLTAEQANGKTLHELFPANSNSVLLTNIITAVNERVSISFEDPLTINSDVTTSLSQVFPIINAQGQVNFVVCISKDISELKTQRDRVNESENTLQYIINSSDNTIIFLAPDFRIIYANTAALRHGERLLGKKYSAGDNIAKYLTAHQFSAFQQHVKQLEENRKPFSFEHNVTYLDGAEAWFLRRYYPVFDSAGLYIGFVVSSINITERKNHELQIHKHSETLREIAQIQSHEIRRPVANILGLTNLIDLTKPATENEEIIALLRKSADELDQMIRVIVKKTNDKAL